MVKHKIIEINKKKIINHILHDVKTFRAKSFGPNSIKKFSHAIFENFVKSYIVKNFGIVVKNTRPTTLFIEQQDVEEIEELSFFTKNLFSQFPF